MRRLLLTFLALLVAGPVAAQEPPSAIRLSAEYNPKARPMIAVRTVQAPAPVRQAGDSIAAIIARDLRFSDRYNIFASAPAQLNDAMDVDYAQWNAFNVVYLVTSEITPAARGYILALTVHDVPYSKVVQQARFQLPGATEPDFRMAVHAVSDEIVRWTLDAQGTAATRIAATRTNSPGSYDLLVMDSDGFNTRRIAGNGGQLYSPVWSDDARRVLFAINSQEGWRLVERDVRSGSQRTINPGQGLINTLEYAPGGKIAIGLGRDKGTALYEYDLEKQCCLRTLSDRSDIEMYPSFSPDGRRMAFVSIRLGNPHVYVMPASGGGAERLSPYVAGQSGFYTSPTWSPLGDRVAFHGTWDQRYRGNYQIMVANPERPGGQIEQITARGNNEDPSFAPDGRHIVFTSVGDGADGLYIIDVETKARRLLAPGGNLRMSDWSPILVRAEDIVVRP